MPAESEGARCAVLVTMCDSLLRSEMKRRASQGEGRGRISEGTAAVRQGDATRFRDGEEG